MKLIGSKPSPYVRRLRLWLEGVDTSLSTSISIPSRAVMYLKPITRR